MGNFEKELIKKIKKLDKKIVFVDGYDNRLYECLKVFVKFNQHIYIIGENKKINHYLKENNITKNDCLEVADPNKFKDFNSYLDTYNKSSRTQNMLAGIGYFAAGLTALFSMFLELRQQKVLLPERKIKSGK